MSFYLAGSVMWILSVVIIELTLIYLKHIWAYAEWIISQAQLSLSSSNYDTQIISRLSALEKQLKKQDHEMSKLMRRVWNVIKEKKGTPDPKKELGQAVKQFWEEQTKYEWKRPADDVVELTTPASIKRLTTTASFKSSP